MTREQMNWEYPSEHVYYMGTYCPLKWHTGQCSLRSIRRVACFHQNCEPRKKRMYLLWTVLNFERYRHLAPIYQGHSVEYSWNCKFLGWHCFLWFLFHSVWNENQLMSLFYSYIAGSLHVHTTYGARVQSGQILNQWLREQLYELSWRWACGSETCRDPAIYEWNSDISWFSFYRLNYYS
jgi:hypothetical protein